jgi:hypothetical protein
VRASHQHRATFLVGSVNEGRCSSPLDFRSSVGKWIREPYSTSKAFFLLFPLHSQIRVPPCRNAICLLPFNRKFAATTSATS